MQQLSRAQRIILIYLLWKSYEFEQELWRPRGGGAGGVSLRIHGNEFHSPDFEEQGLSLLLDGTRSMTGNLDMDTYDILFNDVLLDNTIASTLRLMNHAKTVYKNFRCAALSMYGSLGFEAATVAVYPSNANGSTVSFQTRFGGWNTCAQLKTTGANTGEFNIPLAGDITFADPANNKLTWNDTLRLVKEEDYRLRVEDGDGLTADIHVYTAFMDYIESLVDASTLITNSNVDAYWRFMSHNGAAHVINIQIQGGHVYLPNLPVADPTIAGALWNDGGTVKVSAG